jgi:hypothetical protein
MMVACAQPCYFPWLGYLDKIRQADTFVFLDTVDFDRTGWQHRVQVQTPKGGVSWLTIPFKHAFEKGKGIPFADLEVSDDQWPQQHTQKLHEWYRRAPFFDQYWTKDTENSVFGYFRYANLIDEPHVMTHVLASARILARIFGLPNQKMLAASWINHEPASKSQRLVNICKALKADTYLCGQGGRAYLDEDLFRQNGIGVTYHEYRHPVYSQSPFRTFIPGLSALDFLFHCGPEASW